MFLRVGATVKEAIEKIERLVSDCFKEIVDHSFQSEVRSVHIKTINDNLKNILKQLESLPSRPIDNEARLRRKHAKGDIKNNAMRIAYAMSRFDYPIINDILKTHFNQTEAFEHLAQILDVNKPTLQNYRNMFDPHVKQENSNRRGLDSSELPEEFQTIKDEYNDKDYTEIKNEIETILKKSLPSRLVDNQSLSIDGHAVGDNRNAIIKIAYAMSRFDFHILNDILNKRFNQTKSFKYLAQILDVNERTLRNYRDRFDPYVEQEHSDRKGWWQLDLSAELQNIKIEYDDKEYDEIKDEIATILQTNDSSAAYDIP